MLSEPSNQFLSTSEQARTFTELGREVLQKLSIDANEVVDRQLDDFIDFELTANKESVSPGKRFHGPDANKLLKKIAKAKYERYMQKRLYKLRQIGQFLSSSKGRESGPNVVMPPVDKKR